MTKRRSPLSLEDGVTIALGILGEDGVKAATGKSPRLVRMWSDPDDDTHHLPCHQAVALDRACVAAGEAPPILTAYRALVRGAAGGAGGAPLAQLALVMGEVGDVAREVTGALAPGSAGGVAMTAEERAAAVREIAEARAALDRLEADVLGAPPASTGGRA